MQLTIWTYYGETLWDRSSKTSNHRNQCLCNDNLIIIFFPAAAPGVPCPDCDELLNCVWGRQCLDEHTCMTRSYPNYNFKVHCSVVRYFIFKCLSYLSDEICDKDDTTCSQVSHERNSNQAKLQIIQTRSFVWNHKENVFLMS